MFQMGLSEFQVLELKEREMQGEEHCVLYIFEGPARMNKVQIEHKGITIGRDAQNSLAICEDSQMSNFHAQINYLAQEHTFILKDAGSTNKYIYIYI